MANVDRNARRAVTRPRSPQAAVHSAPRQAQVSLYVFLSLLAIRVVNVFVVQTFFQPDEYFQSLEPAWQLAFGPDSGAWITWEWREGLRSSIHPMLFAAVYRFADQIANILKTAPDSRAQILIVAPRIAQAVIAAIGDFYTWRIGCEAYGPQHTAAYATLALTVLSPWQFFFSTRTFSNSLETTLTAAALYLWPWYWSLRMERSSNAATQSVAPRKAADLDTKEMVDQFKSFLEGSDPISKGKTESTANQSRSNAKEAVLDAPDNLYYALATAAVACTLRPTNIVIWATIAGIIVYRYGSFDRAIKLATAILICGTGVLAVSIGMDRSFYGKWVVPPVNFLYFNIVYAVAGFYGINRIDYYFSEGLPLLLTTALPFAVVGIWTSLRPGKDLPSFQGYNERQTRFVLSVTVLATVITMTMIGHKEMRFIYPLLPSLHVLAAKPMANFFRNITTDKVRLGILLLMLTTNIYIAAYTTLVHKRGALDVMHYLRHRQEDRLHPIHYGYADQIHPISSSNITVGFLMPCHSTPWRSHFVHPQIQAWALTCEPPLHLSLEERRDYQDEADVFYNHPGSWIDDNLKDRSLILPSWERKKLQGQTGKNAVRRGDEERRAWPEYLVFFEHLEPVMSMVLEDTVYEECWRGFNTHWHDDSRRRGDVIVWCVKDLHRESFARANYGI
ncbi:glycosylphosphatidylinositol anchor biosynthesis [Recurvomyces mirabilis]|uniref:Mannosyltransferase n=1 Tax=Recurvomyces mirabilis TaxID=574656 RepID=A0AAE0TQI9_9PEZI|nr:glycosylphosphatidylinositol anchor biosynthesis [Recurvomyces mirabilis]KAK5156555.1 glycosylphosphatidylinositol anchor biosynthesis [Recurvomyces mirabilis]